MHNRFVALVLSLGIGLACLAGCAGRKAVDAAPAAPQDSAADASAGAVADPGQPAPAPEPAPAPREPEQVGSIRPVGPDLPAGFTDWKPMGHLIEWPDARKLGYNLLWAADVGGPDVATVQTVVLGDVIVVLERPSNQATVVSLKDGNVLWRKLITSREDRLISAFRKDKVLLVHSDTAIYQFNLVTGKQIVRHQLTEVVTCAPAVMGDMAIFGGIHGMVFAYDMVSGNVQWRYRLRDGILHSPIDAGGNQVAVADKSGFVMMLQTDRGEALWQINTFGRIVTQPISSNLGIFIACEDHNLYAKNKADGRDREGWPYRTNVRLQGDPRLIDGRYLMAQIPNRGLVAIDAGRKKDLWALDTLAKPIELIKNGMLLNEGTRFIVVDPATGHKLIEVPTLQVQDVIMLPKKSMLLVSPKGRLLRLDPA